MEIWVTVDEGKDMLECTIFSPSPGIPEVYPAMWGDELEMIFKTMANMKPKSYFEWGAGGSTRWFSAFASELVVSVDNFEPWCQKVRILRLLDLADKN
mmetsp:Transcript_12479/g.30721  ORF Transcript_12479/g.30721 Transcript_12479/m.30721 type:complete len:98 (-) Transcript_12479:554-847(-)